MNRTKIVVITIPIYKSTLSKYEIISLDRCFEVLSKYDICFVVPTGLDMSFYEDRYKGFKVIVFEEDCFKSIEGYNKLMLNSDFYKNFSDYKYILIYQTDCYVFEDNLEFWASKGYDYIGGILFNHAWLQPKTKQEMWIAGNGGLSLRKVESFIRTTTSRKYLESVFSIVKKILIREYPIKDIVKIFGVRNNVRWLLKTYKSNEDIMFASQFPKIFNFFKVCPLEEALLFSYDRVPQFLYEYNNQTLPFGTHAWYREDSVYEGNLQFWSRHIDIED